MDRWRKPKKKNVEALTFGSTFIPMRLHRHMRIQMIQRAVRLLASLPSTLVHSFDLFISTTWALVLLRARDGNEGVHLGQRMRTLIASAVGRNATVPDGGPASISPGVVTYLIATRPGGRSRSRCGHGGSRRAVRPVGHAMGMSCVLLWPVRIALRGVALILRHVVILRCIRRVRWVGRTRSGGYRGIYGYFRVRLDVRGVMMVILMPILQGHGRTCCLCHTSCVGVCRMLRCVLLTRNVFRR